MSEKENKKTENENSDGLNGSDGENFEQAFDWKLTDSDSNEMANENENNNADAVAETVDKNADETADNGNDEHRDDTASDTQADGIDTDENGSCGAEQIESDETDNGSTEQTVGERFDIDETESSPQPRPRKRFELVLATALSSCAITLLVCIAVFAVLCGSGTVKLFVSSGSSSTKDYEITSDMLEDVMNSVVVISAKSTLGTSTGTGIIATDDGYIITNYHVVEDAENVEVKLYNGKGVFDASVVGYKESDDIAVIKINASGLRAATFAKSDQCRYGERVYAIGTPEGTDYAWSVTQGIISCPAREVKIYDDDGVLTKKMNLIQTDASVNHGNSGGPLINASGEVVGIVTLKLTNSVGMGFAIPSNGALADAMAIIERGNADGVESGISSARPLLGITGVGVEADTWYRNTVFDDDSTGIEKVSEVYAAGHPSETFYAAVSGVYVSATSNGLDAASKLFVGDIIVEINGEEMLNIYQVMATINNFDGGDTVTVKYYRDGDYATADITLGTQSN